MKFLNTPNKRKRFLKKLKIGFFTPLFILLISWGLMLIEIEALAFTGGLAFIIGYILMEIFLAIFWILNLIMMWKWKKRGFFFLSIILPFVSLIFYWTEFLPFLKEEKNIPLTE